MSTSDRRTFLKTAGSWVAGAVVLKAGGCALPGRREAPAASRTPFPPHRELRLQGVHAYAGAESVRAGEEISFHVSSEVPCRLSVRRPREIDDPETDEVLHTFEETPADPQPIHPGSYVHVERSLDAGSVIEALTLECWVRPWRTDAWMGLLAQHDYPERAGIGLFLAPEGRASLYLGDGGAYREERAFSSPEGALQRGAWHHVAGTWDGVEAALWVDGEEVGRWSVTAPVRAAEVPLRLAAYGEDGVAARFLDGDLALPAMYSSALDAGEIRRRVTSRALELPRSRNLLACWPLSEEKGERIADISRHRRAGRIINHATWMIGGPSFDANVPRFGDYEPSKDARRGHGLRFASDDLYDCRWRPTHLVRVPELARPGIYTARIDFELDGKPHAEHVTFIVRRSPHYERAPILVLAATNTWRAYSSTPFARNLPELEQVWGTNGIANDPADPPAYSFYRGHHAGQGTYQLGLRMPWPVASPYVLYGGPTRYSHLARADLFLHLWLEKEGYEFDVVSDYDLHRDPDRLRHYEVFAVNGHSEYWSSEAYDGLERYLAAGGNVLCLSGNTLFWRVSYDDERAVVECRKVDCPGNQMPAERRGECWHSQDGRRGGLLRECGRPGWRLVGLETLGWINQSDPEAFGPYVVEDAEHFLFHAPEPVGVARGDTIGGVEGGVPSAGGHEVDVRLSALRAVQTSPTPEGAVFPEEPRGIELLGAGKSWGKKASILDYFLRPGSRERDLGAELVYWERPGGGRVFNAGAIGAGWALSVDPKFGRLMRNALAHFGVRPA